MRLGRTAGRYFRGRARGLAGALAIAVLFVSSAAFADARTEARKHFKKGMERISQGKYEEGIGDLQRAYELVPHANVLYNIARAYAEQGALESAVDYYNRYLATNPKDKDDVQSVVTSLEARLKKQQAQAAAAHEAPKEPTPQVTPQEPCAPVPAPVPAPPAAPKEPAPADDHAEDVFAETVVTASKGTQSPLDAPNSTSIITEQDIRLSGITKIPELLRRLAGLEIMEVTGGQTEVAIRGFNQRLSNKTLVLVDGRSVYVDLFGATFWQLLSIGVEDIDRIEVVRGPGSALYGADAFSGVINIITKRPGQGKNGISGGYGSQNQAHGSFWATGNSAQFAWRASAGYDYIPRWSREVPNGRADVVLGVSDQVESARTTRIDLRGSRYLGKDISVGLGGGLTQGSGEILGVGALNDIVLRNVYSTDLTATFDSKPVEARVFWNRFRTDNALNVQSLGQSLLPGRAEQNIIDAEAQYKGSFALGKSARNDLRVGGWYRYKDVAWTYLDRKRYEHHYGLFLHNELKLLGDRLSIIGDYRLDYVPYLEDFFHSPRGAVVVKPSKQQSVRASVATAFRKPTFLESYLQVPVQLPLTGGALLSEGVRSDQRGFKVQAERIYSAEVGYRNQESDLFVFDASMYINRAQSLIELGAIRTVTVGDVARGIGRQDPQTALFPLFFSGFENQCQRYDVYGAEAGVRTFPTDGLDVYGSYTLNLSRQDDAGCSAEQRALIVTDQRTSVHKFNAGVQLRTKVGFDASTDFHYVGAQSWAERVAEADTQRIATQGFELPSYALVSSRVGYRFFQDQADVSVVGWNVLGVAHRQHPFGQLVQRRVMGFFTYRF
jgi:iron complex outermembrane receptor protein